MSFRSKTKIQYSFRGAEKKKKTFSSFTPRLHTWCTCKLFYNSFSVFKRCNLKTKAENMWTGYLATATQSEEKWTRLQICVLSWRMSSIYQCIVMCTDLIRTYPYWYIDLKHPYRYRSIRTKIISYQNWYENHQGLRWVVTLPIEHVRNMLVGSWCNVDSRSIRCLHITSIMWEYFITSTATLILEYEFRTVILITIISY